MLKNPVQPIELSEKPVPVNGNPTSVPAGFEKYVRDSFWDFLSPNKQERKKWFVGEVEAFRLFNKFAEYDLNTFEINRYHDYLVGLRNQLAQQKSNLEAKIRKRAGLEKKEVDFSKGRISPDNYKSLLKNEVQEYNAVVGTIEKLDKQIAEVNAAKETEEKKEAFARKFATGTGHVNTHDTLGADPASIAYAVPPPYAHPGSGRYVDMSDETIAFAVSTMYSGNFIPILDTQRDFLATQQNTFWPGSQTREFANKFDGFLKDKSKEVRLGKQGLVETVYTRLNQRLKSDDMSEATFAAFSKFVRENGNFSTVVIPRSEFKNLAVFIDEENKKLKQTKPGFFRFARTNEMQTYKKKKGFLQGLRGNLGVYENDMHAQLNAAKKDTNSPLAQYLLEYINQGSEDKKLDDAAIEQLYATDEKGNYKNLEAFLTFLQQKEIALNTAISKFDKSRFSTRYFNSEARAQNAVDKKALKAIQNFKKAAEVAIQNGQTRDSTQYIKLVIDTEDKREFLEAYNNVCQTKKKPPLLPGPTLQFLEAHAFLKRKETLILNRYKYVRDDNFAKMIQEYNTYQTDPKKKVTFADQGPTEEEKLKAYEILRKNGDFTVFLENYKEKHSITEESESGEMLFNQYLTNIQLDLHDVQDQFVMFLRFYNQFRSEKSKIDTRKIVSLPFSTDSEVADQAARMQAYAQIQRNEDFKDFKAWYAEVQKAKPYKDITGKERQFGYYLEGFEQELMHPWRGFGARWQERVTSAYDAFGNLLVYGGSSKENQQQLINYIRMMKHFVNSGVMQKIGGHDLTNEDDKKAFKGGLELAGKIIAGEKVPVGQDGKLGITDQANLKLILLEEKRKNTPYGGVAELFITKWSRRKLSEVLDNSNKCQKEIESTGTQASAGELMDLIDKNTQLTGFYGVKNQYNRIGSDALTYFQKLLFTKVEEKEKLTAEEARMALGLLIDVSAGSVSHVPIDTMEKYLKDKKAEVKPEANKLDQLEADLLLKSPQKNDAPEMCDLGEGVKIPYDLTTAKQLLARINLYPDYCNELRKNIEVYLEALQKLAQTNPEEALKVMASYATVYTTVFTQAELVQVSKLLFGILFNPDKLKVEVSKVFEEFIEANRSVIEPTLHAAIANYINKTSHPFLCSNADLIFKFGALKHQQDYTLKRINELLGLAKEKTRHHPETTQATKEFINYMRSKKAGGNLLFGQEHKEIMHPELVNAFVGHLPLENQKIFWSETFDRLACEFYTTTKIQRVRLNQIRYLLNKTYPDIKKVELFYQYLQESTQEKDSRVTKFFPMDANGEEEFTSKVVLDDMFSTYFGSEQFQKAKTQQRLNYLNNAAHLALYFDTTGEWLDTIRLMQVQEVLEGNLSVEEFISNVTKVEPNRLFPFSTKGKESFDQLLAEYIMPNETAPITVRYQYDWRIELLAQRFDSSQKYLTMVRIGHIADLLGNPGTDQLVKVEQYINTLKETTFPNYGTEQTGSMQEELDALFLAYLTQEEPKEDHHYNYSLPLERLIFQWGSPKVREQCIVAKVEQVFRDANGFIGNQISGGLTGSYISNFQSNYPQFVGKERNGNGEEVKRHLHLSEEARNALNMVFKHYLNQPWSLEFQQLIEFFEPIENDGKCLKQYRLARACEIFAGEGKPLSVEEYASFQAMFGTENMISINNLESMFGSDLTKLANALATYIDKLYKLKQAAAPSASSENQGTENNAYIITLITEPDNLFELIKLMALNGLLKNNSEASAKWNKILSDLGNAKQIKITVEEVEADLNDGAYARALGIYKGNARYLRNQKTESNANNDTAVKERCEKIQAGIIYTATEVTKQRIAYQTSIAKTQIKISEIFQIILDSNDIVAIRENVEKLIHILNSGEIPNFVSSAQLRLALVSLQQRENQLKQNMVNVLGTPETGNAREWLELIRVLEATASKELIKVFYQKISAAEPSVPEIVVIANKLVQAFYQQLEKQQLASMQRHYRAYIGEFQDINFNTDIADEIAKLFDPKNSEQKDGFLTALLKIMEPLLQPQEYKELCAAIKDFPYTIQLKGSKLILMESDPNVSLLNEHKANRDVVVVKGTTVHKIICWDEAGNYKEATLSATGTEIGKALAGSVLGSIEDEVIKKSVFSQVEKMRGFVQKGTTGETFKRTDMLNFSRHIFQLLSQTALKKKIVPLETVFVEAWGVIQEAGETADNQDTIVSVFSKINVPQVCKAQLKEIMLSLHKLGLFAEQDYQEFKNAINAMPDKIEGNLESSLELVEKIVKTAQNPELTIEQRSSNLQQSLFAFMYLLNTLRYEKLNIDSARNFKAASSVTQLRTKVQQKFEAIEISKVKEIISPLPGLNENNHIQNAITDMQKQFVCHLPSGAIEKVNYVKINATKINGSFEIFKNILTQCKQNNTAATVELARFTTEELEYLAKGLDTYRKEHLKYLLTGLIEQESVATKGKKDEYPLPNMLTVYLIVLREYVSGNGCQAITAKDNLILSQQSFIEYAENVSAVLRQIEDLLSNELERSNTVNVTSLIEQVKKLASQLSEHDKRIILNKINCENTPVGDVFRILSSVLEGNEVGEEATQAILARYQHYLSIVQNIGDTKAAITETDISTFLAVNQYCSTTVGEAQQKAIQTAIDKLFKQSEKDASVLNYQRLKDVVLVLGTNEQKIILLNWQKGKLFSQFDIVYKGYVANKVSLDPKGSNPAEYKEDSTTATNNSSDSNSNLQQTKRGTWLFDKFSSLTKKDSKRDSVILEAVTTVTTRLNGFVGADELNELAFIVNEINKIKPTTEENSLATKQRLFNRSINSKIDEFTNAILRRTPVTLEQLCDFCNYSADIINVLGNDKQKQVLQACKKLLVYVKNAKTKSGFDLLALQEELTTMLKTQDGVLVSYPALVQLFETAQEKFKICIAPVGISFAKDTLLKDLKVEGVTSVVTSFSFLTVVLRFDEKLGNNFQRLKEGEQKAIINAIATLYLECQLGTKSNQKAVAEKAQSLLIDFLESYIRYKREPGNVLRKVPAELYVHAIIEKLGSPKMKEKLKACDAEHKKHLEWTSKAIQLFNQFIARLRAISGTSDITSISKEMKELVEQVLNDFEPEGIKIFVDACNALIKQRSLEVAPLELKWFSLEGNPTAEERLKGFKEELAKKMNSVFALQYQKLIKNCRQQLDNKEPKTQQATPELNLLTN